MERRHFLKTAGLTAGLVPFLGSDSFRGVEAAVSETAGLAPHEAARDERLWREVKQAFTVNRSLINLDNGYACPTPRVVTEAFIRYIWEQEQNPYGVFVEKARDRREGNVKKSVARLFGSSPDEIALVRNTTEALKTVLYGIPMNPGDEVLTTTQDYGRMLTTFRQRERREGIVMRQIKVPVPAEDPAEVVRRFEEGITPRTRLILMCHMINLTGQILPVREIVAMARKHDVPVIVDGAHAMAHFPFRLRDLECDNYSTSLHKWLFAPHGTGLLYVRRDEIANIWPLMAAPDRMDGDIRKYEEIGTHPAANYLAIGEALTFHQGIGAERKAARLTYLRDYWANRLLENDRVSLNTSQKPGFACGIANVHVEGLDTGALSRWLWSEHRIINVSIGHDECTGLRISPSVYTTLEELDRFSEAMESAIRQGLPEA